MKAKNQWFRIDSIRIGRSFAGRLEGIPTQEDKEEELRKILKLAPSYIKTTVANSIDDGPYYVVATIESEPMNRNKCGSVATLVAFFRTKDIEGVSIENLVSRMLANYSWSNVAEDFDV